MLTLSRDKGAPVPGRRVVPREEGGEGRGGGMGSGAEEREIKASWPV